MKKPISFDMDAVMALSHDELESFLRVNEQEIIELLDMNKESLCKIKDLEKEVEIYKEHIKALEVIKVEDKASKSVWKTIAVAAAAFGALIMAIFDDEDDK